MRNLLSKAWCAGFALGFLLLDACCIQSQSTLYSSAPDRRSDKSTAGLSVSELARFRPVVSERTHGSVTADLSQGASFEITIRRDLPNFTFKVIPEVKPDDPYGNTQSTVKDIEVYRGDSKQPFQHLTGCDWVGMQAPRDGSDWFHADDFNFDGYTDIYLLTSWGATGNENGCVWLFNPKSEKFDYSKEFSELGQYRLDPAAKTILDFENGGGGTYSAQRYKVEQNHMVLIWSQSQSLDDSFRFRCVVKELHGKNLITVRDQRARRGANPCPAGDLFP